MTLQQLRYIVELSKHTSISATAQALFISQPSLSTAIREVEKEFHITLLERNRHGISFTPAGLEFLNHATHIIEDAASLRDHFHLDDTEQDASKVRLSISSQHYMFAVDALTSYLAEMVPGSTYDVTLREERTSQVLKDVMMRRSEIGLIFISNMTRKFMTRTLRRNGLSFTELFSYPPAVFLKADHPLAKYKTLSLEQLNPYPYVQYTQGEDTYQFSEEIVMPDIKPQHMIHVTDRSTLFSIIKETDAYTVSTGILFHSLNDQFTAIPLKNSLDIMCVGWIKPDNASLSPEARNYIEQVQKTLTAHRLNAGQV